MATKRKGKSRSKARRRRHGFWYRLLRALFRRTKRRVKTRWGKIKRRVGKAFEPKVIKSYKADRWKDQFPDPRKPRPFVMTKVDPKDDETYQALFDGLLVVPFSVHSRSGIKLTDAAQEAAEAEHGPIAQSWVLISIEGTNDPAREVLAAFPGGVFKP